MKLFAITIKPRAAFGTPLKGDTLFGSFCWQAAQDEELLTGGLSTWIERYSERPFLVLSSAFPQIVGKDDGVTYALPRPALPQSWLDPGDDGDCAERLKSRKEKRARRWLLTGEDLTIRLDWEHLVDDGHLSRKIAAALGMDEPDCRFLRRFEQSHNTINRLTNTTGKGFFAPYSMENFSYLPGMDLVIFALLDEEALSEEKLLTGLERIGAFGFGRDASTGLGRFLIGECKEISRPDPDGANAIFTLSPWVPAPEEFDQTWFTPFTRFGRHGAQLLHTGRPFKNPVVMADEGAVFRPRKAEQLGGKYCGRAVTGISKAQPEAVCQGYAVALPMQLPVQEGQ